MLVSPLLILSWLNLQHTISEELIDRPSLTLILHTSHEGAHAICAEMGKMCFQASCNEVFEQHYFNITALINWASQAKYSAALAHLQLSEAERLRTKFQLNIIMLVRTNLFDWAFSNYWKLNAKLLPERMKMFIDPQFNKDMTSDELPVVRYDPDIFLKTMKELFDRWKMRKIAKYKKLKSNGFNVKWMIYEKFAKNGTAALVETLEALGVEFPDHGNCSLGDGITDHRVHTGTNVHRVHTKKTKDYMLNYEECMAKFKEYGFFSFEELSVNCQTCEY